MRTYTDVATDAMRQYRSALASRRTTPVPLDRRVEVEKLAVELNMTSAEVRALRCRGLLETPAQRDRATTTLSEYKRMLGARRIPIADAIAAVRAASEDEE